MKGLVAHAGQSSQLFGATDRNAQFLATVASSGLVWMAHTEESG